MKKVNTAELARKAIQYSIRHHVSRAEALAEVLKKVRLKRPAWITRTEARERREILFCCVLGLIPHFEPNRFNAHYSGIRKPNPNRLHRLAEQEAQKGENLPFLTNPPKKLQW